MKTYSAKLADVKNDWWVVDAKDLVLGRVSAEVAKILRGKHKPMYSPNLDCGDNVVIVNAEKVHMTGLKQTDKKYYRHTGHPGGIKETTPGKILSGQFPERVMKKAIERMLPRTPMGRQQLSKLYVYAGDQHPHAGQQPKALDLASQNEKNKKVRS